VKPRQDGHGVAKTRRQKLARSFDKPGSVKGPKATAKTMMQCTRWACGSIRNNAVHRTKSTIAPGADYEDYWF